MNNRPIKILTLCGLLAILALQGIWLFTTYSTVRNETIKKSNELFKTAVTTELHMRMDNYTDEDGNDVSIEKNFHMDLSDNIDYSDYAVNKVYLFIQETMDTLLHVPVALDKLDSIYQVQLEQANIHTQTTCNLVDSTGSVLSSSVPDFQFPHDYQALQTDITFIKSDNSQGLQVVLINPYGAVFRQMGLLLVATGLIMVFVVYCILYQIKIISKQNKIARMREDFSYAMIHDMKTPLSSIIMCANFLHSGRLDDKPEIKEKYFTIIENESDHLLMLTNKVLTLSKLENHKLEMAKSTFELQPMMADLKEKFTTKATKPVHITINLQADTAYADDEFIKEAISNLLDNSIKYSGESVNIDISSQVTDKYTLIKVRDNGIGISEKDMKTIFDKFERASASLRTKSGGTTGFGLGLNYVYQVMEAHEGKVIVNSLEGEFSEFTLYIPRKTTAS